MAALTSDIDPDGGGDYTSINAFDNGAGQDLTDAGGDTMTATCTSSSGTADTTAAILDNWTTGAATYLEIIAASGDRTSASGWDASKYRLSVTDNNVLDIREDYVRIRGLQIEFIYSSVIDRKTIFCGVNLSVGNYLIIDSCYIRKGSAGGSSHDGIYPNQDNIIIDVFNCIIADFTRNGIGVVNQTTQIFNNTIYGCNTGIWDFLDVGETLTIKNNAVFKNVDDFNVDQSGDGTVVVDYNASDDNDGTNNVAESGGGVEWPDDFVDAANGDFTLKSGSGLVGNGTDDPGSGLYSDDINGDIRTSTWDVGADEFISAAGTTISVVASDGIVLDESAGRVATYRVSASDGLALNDSDSGLASLLASASDSITVDDNVSALLSLLAAATDSITLDDTSTRTITYQVASVDGITLGDTSTVTFKLLVTAADGIVLDDAASVTITLAASALDSIVVNDTATSLLSLLASALDGITLQDISTASLPSDITGKLSITFSTKKSTITFTIKKPSVAFTEKKPSITFTGV